MLMNDAALYPLPLCSYFYFLLIYQTDTRQLIPFSNMDKLFSAYICTMLLFFFLEESKHIPNHSLKMKHMMKFNSHLMESSIKKNC